MASCVDEERAQQISHSDELLRVPFRPENSKFLITKESKVKGKGAAPDIFKVDASSVLSRVKNFLPKMKEAEQKLEKEIHLGKPSKLDIETVEESSPYIEMNLALVETQTSESEDSCEESEDDQDIDVDETCQVKTQEIDCGPVTQENFVITRTARDQKKPMIEELSSQNTETVKKGKKGKGCKTASKRKRKREQ